MHWNQESRDKHAFAVTDLLLVIAVVTVFAALAMAFQGSSEHVLRAQCASNLRQIGQALNVYAAESDDYLPICKFRDTHPWYTYDMARMVPGTSNLTLGFGNLGLLFRTKVLPRAESLYCPGQNLEQYTCGFYATATNEWPFNPAAAIGILRSGFNYFPQTRVTEAFGRNGALALPKVTLTTLDLEFGSLVETAVTPKKLGEVNPQKSVATDLVHATYLWSHQTQGEVSGLNALFPDGAVVFQNAKTWPQNSDSSVWQGIGNNGLNFRIVMNGWQR